MEENFFDAQALRMLRAFFKVREHDARELLVSLAEAAGRGASIGGTVDEVTVKSDGGAGKIVALPTSRNSAK